MGTMGRPLQGGVSYFAPRDFFNPGRMGFRTQRYIFAMAYASPFQVHYPVQAGAISQAYHVES